MPSIHDIWIEAFKAGTHTDSRGRVKTWGQDDIEKAVTTFDNKNEPPNVIGHPADNMPAYGWINAAKRVGEGMNSKLLVKLKEVPKAFEDMIRAGRFKKRSISFDSEGRIRHLGWLGAATPSVVGLLNVDLNIGDETSSIEMDLGEVTPNNFSAEDDMADEKKDKEIQELKDSIAAKDKEIATQKSEFTTHKTETEGAITKLTEKYNNFVTEHSKVLEASADAQRGALVDQLVADSKILPADKPMVVAFAKAVAKGAEGQEPVDFSGEEGAEKKTLEVHFMGYIGRKQAHQLFDPYNGLVKPRDKETVVEGQTDFTKEDPATIMKNINRAAQGRDPIATKTS